MAAWVDLSTIHNPSPGRRPPASWGDGVATNLENLAGAAAAYIATSQTTTGVMGDLSTPGPAVTVDTGASALVLLSCTFNNSSTSQYTIMAFAVSGATTIAASYDQALYSQSIAASADMNIGTIKLVTGLTPGSNTFTAKYGVTGGTGTFYRRMIAVIPLF